MQAHLTHMQFNVQPKNMAFYKDLLAFVGWQSLYDSAEMIGVIDKNGISLWFVGQAKAVSNDYDGPGMNHLALAAASQAEVDAVAAYLTEHDVELLFETPRHRAEFTQSAKQTYYQVMFEAPDRILIEVVYTGPKGAS
jgi:catechol 2,3-dioxygenase-like lactoylglutathione lyase family enzyme